MEESEAALAPELRVGGYLTAADFTGQVVSLYPERMGEVGLSEQLAKQIGLRPEVCDGVPSPHIVFPDAPITLDVWSGGHLFFVQTFQFGSGADAGDAFDQISAAFRSCSEDAYVGEHDLPVIIEIDEVLVGEHLIPTHLTGFSVTTSTISLKNIHEVRIGVAADSLFIVGTSYPASIEAMTGLISSRLVGESNGTVLAPEGTWEWSGGYTSGEFWSMPDDGSARLRASVDSASLEGEWMAAIDDERLDEVAASACGAAILNLLLNEPGEVSLADLAGNLFNYYEREAHDDNELALILGSLLGVYCPNVLADYA